MDGFILKNFIIKWNNTFILDRWFRKKYNIPFNSMKHRELNPIDIRFEYEEDLFFKEHSILEKEKEKNHSEYQEDGKLFNLNKLNEKLSDEELDNLFDSINLADLNQNINNKGE